MFHAQRAGETRGERQAGEDGGSEVRHRMSSRADAMRPVHLSAWAPRPTRPPLLPLQSRTHIASLSASLLTPSCVSRELVLWRNVLSRECLVGDAGRQRVPRAVRAPTAGCRGATRRAGSARGGGGGRRSSARRLRCDRLSSGRGRSASGGLLRFASLRHRAAQGGERSGAGGNEARRRTWWIQTICNHVDHNHRACVRLLSLAVGVGVVPGPGLVSSRLSVVCLSRRR